MKGRALRASEPPSGRPIPPQVALRSFRLEWRTRLRNVETGEVIDGAMLG